MRSFDFSGSNAALSPFSDIDARAKLLGLIIFLVAVATSHRARPLAAYALLLLMALFASRLPVSNILLRAAAALPFSATFALVTWWSAGPTLALLILEKSFLSALAVVMVMAATPLPDMARALAWFRMPAMLVLVLQFLYRYLWVTAGQARSMQLAARSRAGQMSARSRAFEIAAGAIGTLFSRSSERAENIYQAMLARRFTGVFPALAPMRFGMGDVAIITLVVVAVTTVRLWF